MPGWHRPNTKRAAGAAERAQKLGAHSVREVRRERMRALRELVDTSHWLTLDVAAPLIPMDPVTLRRWLQYNAHHLSCDRCPVYRLMPKRGRGIALYRALSPRDVREIRTRYLRRVHHPTKKTKEP